MHSLLTRTITISLLTLTSFTVRGQNTGILPVRIQQIETMLPSKPVGLGTPCSDRNAWQSVSSRFQVQIRQAESYLPKPIPEWNDDAYLNFTRTGNRTIGENMLYARQNLLAPLVLAECAEGKGRFLQKIAQVLDQLSAQKSWTYPAHDPKLDSFSGRRYFVELNSAELANQLAETLYLLGNQLPASTRSHVINTLEARIFAPMRTSYKSGKGQNWFGMESNWTPVCLAGITGAALAVLPDKSDRALFVAGAEYYSSYYLKGFPDDGYGVEGIGYWNLGFSRFAQLREELWRATNGGIDLFKNQKAEKVSLFGAQFQMLPGVVADFGDSAFMSKPDNTLVTYINKIFGLGLSTYNTPLPAQGSLIMDVLTSFPSSSALNYTLSRVGNKNLIGLRTYYPDSGVLVSRPLPGGQFAVTIKADANSSHSHDDIGSFSIGMGNTQPLGDPGGPMFYTAQTFTSNRFQSKLLNSYGHPVPVIADSLQLDASKVHAKVLHTDFTDDSDSIIIDMTPAYSVPQLQQYQRIMHYSRTGNGSMEIEDKFEIQSPTKIEEALPTHGTWKQLDAHTLEFTMGSEHLRATIDAPYNFKIVDEKINDYGNPFTRVGIQLLMKKSGTIKINFSPA